MHDDDDTVQTFTLLQIGCYGFHNEQPSQKRKTKTTMTRRNILRRMQLTIVGLRKVSKNVTPTRGLGAPLPPSLRINIFLGPIASYGYGSRYIVDKNR